jgi:phenylalanyl-tRNA synthetase beta chain
MIITRQWIQEYIDISKISTKTMCEALDSIGLEVDSAHRVLIPNGVVIGKVEECEKHPDADKLSVCQVNIGEKTTQIVCGAKNVAKGQYVPVATVGTVLGENFKIKKAKLRGVESLGMICSTTEIGLPKMNDGILELDDSIGELTVGRELNEYSLINDEVIEIELTANRGDCLSIHGVARELSTYFNIPMKNIDNVVNTNNKGIGQIFELTYNTACESNLIFKAADIKNFKLNLLELIRVATVQELRKTDIENAAAYSTHSTGVLLNVYSKSIAAQQSNDLISLTIEKNENGFDTVKGKETLSTIGIETGSISQQCDEVIIEANYTNPEVLSQKVFDTKQKTGDVYYRSSRGSETDLNLGIDYFISLLSKNGGSIYNGSQDYINDLIATTLTVSLEKINKIIGQTISEADITKILMSLGFEVKSPSRGTLTITIPTFRHDIKNIADITEEIVRIIGIDQIKSKPVMIKESNRINETSNKLVLQNNLRAKAISNNFYETVTYAFTNKDNLQKYGFETVNNKKDIMNPIVNELNTFRTTLAMNLALAISENQKQGFKSIGLFEIGTVFDKNRNEKKNIAFIFSGETESEAVRNHGKPEKIDFFAFAQKVSNVVGDFELEALEKIENGFIHPYQSGKMVKNGETIGKIYKLHPTVANELDVDSDTFICEIDFDKLEAKTIFANNISKFQSSKRDLSIIAPKELEYKQIKKVINSLNIQQIKQYNLVDIYSDEKLGDKESLTIKFVLQSDEKTMEESEINSIMDKILENLDKELGIGIR